MSGLVVANCPRNERGVGDGLAACGVVPVQEAQGRKGLMQSYLRSIHAGGLGLGICGMRGRPAERGLTYLSDNDFKAEV